MNCNDCEKIRDSYSKNPFIPPNGLTQEIYQCSCGQWWWIYNNHYHLWSKVNDDATLENIKQGCPKPVAIGNPSTNLSNLVENGDFFV